MDELANLAKKDRTLAGQLQKKLQHYAKAGFNNYCGGANMPIRDEGGGVYRIGIRQSLFRIIGFFSRDDTAEFIALDAYLKQGKKLGSQHRQRLNRVRQCRQSGKWRKVEDHE